MSKGLLIGVPISLAIWYSIYQFLAWMIGV